MSNKDISIPAFPCTEANYTDPKWTSDGMSLRDYFAAKAMQAMCEEVSRYDQFDRVAKDAYKMADAMIEARKYP